MKIACFILGTRGDVQPMVALATGLINHGHEVIVCAPPEHEELVQKYGCRFVPYGINIKKTLKEKPEEQKGGMVIKLNSRRSD
jgi:UDP:flavonoid glycosyltransferase YjiC (YdhE family)